MFVVPWRAAPRGRGMCRSLLRPVRGLAQQSVLELFETMGYTTAPESPALAHKWIESHGGKFGVFVRQRLALASQRHPANDRQQFCVTGSVALVDRQ